MRNVIATRTPYETQKLSKYILQQLLRTAKSGRASVVGLSGELGAGKTTLIQGIGKVLGVKEKMQSPTFVFVRTHALLPQRNIPWGNVVHIDAYRIERRKEAAALKLTGFFKNQRNLILVEWPEKIKYMLPKQAVWVGLKHAGGNHRHVIIRDRRQNMEFRI